jgi:hypothetical protein
VFGTDTVTDQPTPQSLTWDEDRGQALDDLAYSVGGRWYALGDGTFVVRPYDYQLGPVVQEFRDGNNAFLDGGRGLLTEATILSSRTGVINSAVVISERPDGSAPVRAIARDDLTGSPTQFGGLFGRVSQINKVQTPLTPAQAGVLARTQLQSSGALKRVWGVNVVPDHALEPGDTVDLEFMDVRDRQIIDSITYPLENQTPMAITTRAGMTTGVS